jgi:hypothetical protein
MYLDILKNLGFSITLFTEIRSLIIEMLLPNIQI